MQSGEQNKSGDFLEQKTNSPLGGPTAFARRCGKRSAQVRQLLMPSAIIRPYAYKPVFLKIAPISFFVCKILLPLRDKVVNSVFKYEKTQVLYWHPFADTRGDAFCNPCSYGADDLPKGGAV